MNYLKELNAFYDLIELDSLSDAAISMWHTLMLINNKRGWEKEFTVPASAILTKSGLTESSFKRARKELKEKGYIKHRSAGRNKAPFYQMISRVKTYQGEDLQNATTNLQAAPSANTHVTPHANHPTAPDTVSLFKRKEANENEKVVCSVPDSCHAFYEQNIGMLSPFIAERITVWIEEMGEELVSESMRIAVAQEKRQFQYCEGVLNRWQSLKVKTLDDVRREERQYRKASTSKANSADTASIFDELRKAVQA
ncbi:DnaD domain-containing protein [Halobacillus massiliensis]|uniref:DnaD domain-containing protein n=1 Tax=Halobacillus massiliensis TaxID=1926286 RepID=UPI0009E62386|nr:DnaD domain protein [Halobacillus massiliensis]